MKTLLTLTVILLAGCGVSGHGGQYVALSGTPEGIRALGDTLNGALKTAKEGPDSANQYFAARADYESQVTAREAHPGLFNKLFSPSATKVEAGS